MLSRPFVALHMSTGTKTFVAGRNPTGSVNAVVFVPDVAIAPLKWMMPPSLRTAALLVENGAFVHPFVTVNAVNALALIAYVTPSSDVKQAAFEKTPPSACTVTVPFGWIRSRPLVAPHRSTGTYTSVAGRASPGSVNGSGLVPAVRIAPLKCTMPFTTL